MAHAQLLITTLCEVSTPVKKLKKIFQVWLIVLIPLNSMQNVSHRGKYIECQLAYSNWCDDRYSKRTFIFMLYREQHKYGNILPLSLYSTCLKKSIFLAVSDVDECLKPKACGSNAFCTDSYGNYTCTCNEGYQGNPYDGVSKHCIWQKHVISSVMKKGFFFCNCHLIIYIQVITIGTLLFCYTWRTKLCCYKTKQKLMKTMNENHHP